MKNKDFFIKKIKEASVIRRELNKVHWKKMNNIAKIFNLLFDKDAKEFIHAKNLLYYRGGWPSENTPPRMKTLAYNIANAYIILSFLGKQEELDGYLKDKGVKITLDEDVIKKYFNIKVLESRFNVKYGKAKKLWKEVFNEDINHELDEKSILDKLMKEALDEQYIICKMADEIKITKGNEVKDKCQISETKNFTDLVYLNFALDEGKDIKPKIDNTKESIDEKTECLNTYKENIKNS